MPSFCAAKFSVDLGDFFVDYRDALYPWCIIRLLPQCQRLVVGCFRSCSAAENHLEVLRCLVPMGNFVVVFDPPEERQR